MKRFILAVLLFCGLLLAAPAQHNPGPGPGDELKLCRVCVQSGFRATPNCPHTRLKMVGRPYYSLSCPIHRDVARPDGCGE